MADAVFRYFPDLSEIQREQFILLGNLYEDWNRKINVISRKDMDNLYIHHILHSLSIAKFTDFKPGTKVLDVGTGGGFPGIPLAIVFPLAYFTLLDSIGKKITVVSSVARELGLPNVIPVRKRVEEEKNKYEFIISRAVSEFAGFVRLTEKNLDPAGKNKINNGIIYLKGGDMGSELAPFKDRVIVKDIKDYFQESFFETKKIIYLPF